MAAAALIAMTAFAAPALACVYFAGAMTVTAQSPGSGTVSETGDGGYMTSCVTTGGAVIVSGVSTVAVSVAPGTCTGTTRLASGVYTISMASAGPCMDKLQDTRARGIDIGTLVVDGSGVGSGSYVVPSLAGGTLGVCVTGPMDAPARGIPAQGGGVSVTVI